MPLKHLTMIEGLEAKVRELEAKVATLKAKASKYNPNSSGTVGRVI